MDKHIFTRFITLCLICSLFFSACGSRNEPKNEQDIQGEQSTQSEQTTQSTQGEEINKDEQSQQGSQGEESNKDEQSQQGSQESSRLGITFNDAYECSIEKAFSTLPTTYEAWIRLPEDYPTRAGVILGNYDDAAGKTGPYYSFEIYNNGAPRLYHKAAGGDAASLVFNNVNVCTGEWLHLAIINDCANKKAYCYVNGELKQQLAAIQPVGTTYPAMLGNDPRDNGKQSFKGEISSVAVYGDVRTEKEIQEDMTKWGKDNLIAAWDFSTIPQDGKILDLSGNNYHIHWVWMKEKPQVKDFAYSFVLVGDTQSVNIYDPGNLATIYDWIVENKASKKIAYVMGLGDITDKDQDAEWERAVSALKKLDNAAIGYSLARGNHDSSAKINSTFNKPPYAQSFNESFGNTIANTYRTIVVNGIKYLIFTLDFGASDNVLAWASEIIEAHSDHNVIITTHAYLYRDGTTLDINDVSPPSKYGEANNGDDIWDKFISKHKNIVLVVSGHDPEPRVICTQTAGVNGNVVTQLLSDHQYVDRDLHNAGMDTTGMVTVLHFSADGSKVSVECYSTVYKMYFMHDNQFDFTLNVIK